MGEDFLDLVRKKVGIIPWWIRYFPTATKISGIAGKSRFLLNPTLYKDLMSEHPSDYVVGLVLHELEHMKRLQGVGFLKYYLSYCVSPKFRYQEEIACHKPQFAYLKKHSFHFDIKKRAKILSGSLYFWCVSYEKAYQDLKELWDCS